MNARVSVIGLLSVLTLAGCTPWLELQEPAEDSAFAAWNRIALDASGLDHTPAKPGESRIFGHQLGPTRASRAMAIVHIAMFDAFNAVTRDYESYTGIADAPPNTSVNAAVAQAAHDALVAMFPSHAPTFDEALAASLADVLDPVARANGVTVGRAAADAILEMREGDGADVPENYVVDVRPGQWRPDLINPTQQPLGEEWPNVTPFVMHSGVQFRAPPPPAMDSAEYAEAFEEVKWLGADGVNSPTTRTDEQTLIGIYWAYDGTPSLCAPPRLYNQLASQLALEQGLDAVDYARAITLVNVAMADAAIAVWDSKFYYNLWRPICGVREADPNTGPTGLGDGNPATLADVDWVPLCAPATNLTAPNFTPPFPAYPSGHAGFGGALFETLRNVFGRDDIAFTFVSDELNGETRDNEGNVRPLVPRSFESLSQAEEENGQSRIYLGIHWSFDKTEGIAQGRQVADFVYDNVYRRR